MYRFVIAVLWVLLAGIRPAEAQSSVEDYYPYAGEDDLRSPAAGDTTLFYRAVQQGGDLYGGITDFNLPRVAVGRRGEPFFAEEARADGIPLSWHTFGLLRLMGAGEEYRAGAVLLPDGMSGGGMRRFGFGDQVALRPLRVALSLSDRNYRARLRVVADTELGRSWALVAAVDARTGRDARIDGVFTHALDAGLRLRRRLACGGGIAFTVLMPVSLRAGRTSASGEAFRLTGDRFYNPSWGWQDGRVRSARVRRNVMPVAWAVLERPVFEHFRLNAVFGVEGGRRSQSGLGWYDARTPLPDNYRYLPSFTGDVQTEAAWRNADPRVVQIDWDELIRRNRMTSDGHAVYAVEDHVERLLRLHARVRLEGEVAPQTEVWAEAGWSHGASRRFRRMRDLLGADHITDIDQYLIDDDTYDNKLQNDLRHPDRTIRRGDRFGHDFSLRCSQIRLAGGVEYRADRLHAGVSASVVRHTVQREGHFEKELFPGAGSYGKSRRLSFTPYALTADCGYAFSPRSYLGLRLATMALMPEEEDLFVQPLYNNRTADGVGLRKVHAVELLWRLSGRRVDVEAAVFGRLSLDETDRMNCFDDTAGVYCDLTATGIGRAVCGVELASRIRLGWRWTLSVALGALRSRYVRDPRVTVLSDTDNAEVDRSAASRMKGCVPGNMPQVSGVAELAWRGAKGWSVRCSAACAGGGHVAPSLLRRTDRVARQVAATPEMQRRFLSQESLGTAFTLNLSVLKCFYFEDSLLALNLFVGNLTDHDALHSGYESSRVTKYRGGAEEFVRPQDSRFFHALPRTWVVSVSYRF